MRRLVRASFRGTTKSPFSFFLSVFDFVLCRRSRDSMCLAARFGCSACVVFHTIESHRYVRHAPDRTDLHLFSLDSPRHMHAAHSHPSIDRRKVDRRPIRAPELREPRISKQSNTMQTLGERKKNHIFESIDRIEWMAANNAVSRLIEPGRL